VFTNRRHNRLKILCWNGAGLWVLTKRSEQGTFSWPKTIEAGTTKLSIRPEALALPRKLGANPLTSSSNAQHHKRQSILPPTLTTFGPNYVIGYQA
jgi:transposase